MPTTIDGTTGVDQVQAGAKQNGMEGEICWFARITAPAGFLKANGAAVSRSTYAALFAAIGITWGAGDGSTTFNLPDLRGEFPRGLDDGRGVDAGRALGTAQLDAMQGHIHAITNQANNLGGGGSGANVASGGTNLTTSSPLSDGTNGTPRTAAETRPRNVALLACIRF